MNETQKDNSTIWITLSGIALLALAMLAGMTLAGCSMLDRMYDQKVTLEPGQITATNTVYWTNVVVQPAVTNPATGEITPARLQHVITPEITYEYGSAVTKTNLVPKPGVDALIGVGGSMPIPWAGPLGIVVGAAYGIYAAARNKKAARAVILGVEAGRKILQETPEGQKLDSRLRAELIKHQEAAGVVDQVASMVKEYTGKTKQSVN
jgi:hypothetical protein